MPGATFTHAVRPNNPLTNDHGGVYAARSKTRRPPDRRAGSANTTSYAVRSVAVASAVTTSPGRPRAARLARAAAAVAGSCSIPVTRSPARAAATRSPPIPQPRSTTEAAGSSRAIRAARWSATWVRVACSRPSGVKNIRAASAPNLAVARCRRAAWVSVAATTSASYRLRSAAVSLSSAPGAYDAQASASTPAPGAVSSAVIDSAPGVDRTARSFRIRPVCQLLQIGL